jgi:hypothetical protein
MVTESNTQKQMQDICIDINAYKFHTHIFGMTVTFHNEQQIECCSLRPFEEQPKYKHINHYTHHMSDQRQHKILPA